jgi:predicted nucleic acid-binding Zn ribbon protein
MGMPRSDDEQLAADFRHKRVRLPPPRTVGDAIGQLFAKRAYAQVQVAAGCEAAWRLAAGEKFALHTRPGNVKRGVLEVAVRNSATLQELAFIKVKIVKQLAQLAPEHKIRDVRFRIGAVD